MSKQEYKSIKPGEYVPFQPTANDPDVALVRDRIKLWEEEEQLKEEVIQKAQALSKLLKDIFFLDKFNRIIFIALP